MKTNINGRIITSPVKIWDNNYRCPAWYRKPKNCPEAISLRLRFAGEDNICWYLPEREWHKIKGN